MSRGTFTVSAVQGRPALFDRERGVAEAAEHVRALGPDSDLVAFPESFVPGYPDWVWRSTPFADGEWFRRFEEQSVDLDGDDLDPVRDACRDTGTWAALGVTERDGGTLYNTIAYVDAAGVIAARHRKLMPTGAERLVWGQGHEHLLTTVDVGGVRVGGLICWENYMPLARQAMYEQGVDVLLAPTWDNSDVWVPTLRHIAKEGRCFVVGITCHVSAADVPDDLEGVEAMYRNGDDEMSRGNTSIVGPGGELLAGPLVDECGVLTERLDLGEIAANRRAFDPVGHYNRPEVFASRREAGAV